MEFINVNAENIENEHICCAISNNRDIQVMTKKKWLSDRFADGLVFRKLNERGKCFIEYIPAEKAWAPVCADGYMYIDCLWVSGKFKGMGYSNALLESCISDSKAKGKKGLVILSSDKKRGFLADSAYLNHKGFLLADKAEPYFELWYLPFSDDTDVPQFAKQVKTPCIDEKGFVLYYTNQCPFTAKYVPVIENIAKEKGLDFKTVRIETTKQAQSAPSPFTAYSLFYNGEFVTHEILSDKKFIKILDSIS